MRLFWYFAWIFLVIYCKTEARCYNDEFECYASDFHCIDESQVCDATADCWFMDDELNCTECGPGAKKCDYSQQCVNASQWCDGWINCYDHSDETDCSDCPLGTKPCNETLKCVKYKHLCDGKRDCPDGSDEQNCGKCPAGHLHCNTENQCVPECAICDGLPDCLDGSDEMFCRACRQQWEDGTIQCVGRKEPCNDYTTGVTVGWELFNSTTTHCQSKENKSEFLGIYSDMTCKELLGPCGELIDKACRTGEWLCEDPHMETDGNLLQCDNGNFIPSHAFCNGYVDCNDDEVTDRPGFKCWGPKCKIVDGKRVKCCVLPQRNIYDSKPQCMDESDVCFVNGLFTCFVCDDQMLVVSQQQVCDGIKDCYGGSDERWCGVKHVERVDQHTENTIRCSVKKPASGCKQSTVDVFAVKCNGVPECGNMMDECAGCDDRPSFCDVPCIRNLSRFGLACVGIDDPTCSERGLCPERFDCANKKLTSVESWKKCDGINHCDDHSDEEKGLCNKTRFYCLNSIPLSVDIRLVEDGLRQCSDGSDECLPKSKNARFDDAREMISNTAFRAVFWVIGFAAATGNIVVFFTSLKDLIRNKEVDNVTKSTYIVLLSLSPADFLMGMYLIAISITSATFSGKYCLFDLSWRTSTGCSILGMISILATMASSGTMAVMTAFRLLTILKPFIILKLKYVYISCACAWLLALFLSAVPLFNYSSGYFVYEAWFESRFFNSSEVTKRQLIDLATELRPLNSSSHSWHEAISIINASFPNQLKGVFGYYGETSVCMPRLFASVDDAAWEYSVFLLTLNFVFFIFMLVAYAIIYAESNKMAGGRNEQPSNKMQKRIFRLLLSDFCCWIPICVLGYLAVAGVHLPTDVYIISAGFLLPINSALNPILYSSALERFCGRFKKYLCSLCKKNN